MWMIIGLILFAIGLILAFIAARFESKSINAFIAESGDKATDKYPEILQFLRNYRGARSEAQRQQIRYSQPAFWEYRTKKIVLASIALFFIFLFCVILALTISL
jgi:hypothetical protein